MHVATAALRRRTTIAAVCVYVSAGKRRAIPEYGQMHTLNRARSDVPVMTSQPAHTAQSQMTRSSSFLYIQNIRSVGSASA